MNSVSLKEIHDDLDVEYDTEKHKYKTFCDNILEKFFYQLLTDIKNNKSISTIKININEYTDKEWLLINRVADKFCKFLDQKSYTYTHIDNVSNFFNHPIRYKSSKDISFHGKYIEIDLPQTSQTSHSKL